MKKRPAGVRAMEAIDSLPHGIKWVFTNPKTGNHWSQRHLNSWWREIRAETGIQGAAGEKARFYDFRATCATQLNKAKVTLPVIKETLGHSDYRQLESYLHVDDNDISDGADQLEEYTEALRRKGPKRAPERRPISTVDKKSNR